MKLCSTALTAKRMYCLQIKKIILLCITWMGMWQTPPLKMKCLPGSISYICRKCSRAVYCANAELQLFLAWAYTRKKLTPYMSAEIWQRSDVLCFRWLMYFPEPKRKKQIFFFNYAAELIRNSSTLLNSYHIRLVTLLHAGTNPRSKIQHTDRAPVCLLNCDCQSGNIHTPTLH